MLDLINILHKFWSMNINFLQHTRKDVVQLSQYVQILLGHTVQCIYMDIYILYNDDWIYVETHFIN